jgi:hypothetical protein
MAKGGARVGAGRKPGKKEKHTIEKEKARVLWEKEMLKQMRPILQAQLVLARGSVIMMQRRMIKGKRVGDFERVENESEIARLLNSDCQNDDFYILAPKDPNGKAIQDIMDRLFGKPKETMELSGKEGEPIPLVVVLKTAIEKTYEGRNRSGSNRQPSKDSV